MTVAADEGCTHCVLNPRLDDRTLCSACNMYLYRTGALPSDDIIRRRMFRLVKGHDDGYNYNSPKTTPMSSQDIAELLESGRTTWTSWND